MAAQNSNITTASLVPDETGASKKEHPLKTAHSPAVNTPDFRFENHFSICILHPLTDAAQEWVEDHIGQDNGYQPQYPSVLIEPRFCADVLAGLQNDGLSVVLR